MAELYKVVLSDNACDICQSMDGIYDYPPDVPFHEHCGCTYEELENYLEGGLDDSDVHLAADDDADSDVVTTDTDCEFEVRNLHCEENIYTQPLVMHANIATPLAEALEEEFTIELEALESWDHPLVKEAGGFTDLPDQFTVDVTIPAGTSGTVGVEIEITYRQVICSGELWKVCYQESVDAENSLQTEYIKTETHVDMVGGGFDGAIDAELKNIDFDPEPVVPEREPIPYFEDDDEVPT